MICTRKEELGNAAQVIITVQCSICSQLNNTLFMSTSLVMYIVHIYPYLYCGYAHEGDKQMYIMITLRRFRWYPYFWYSDVVGSIRGKQITPLHTHRTTTVTLAVHARRGLIVLCYGFLYVHLLSVR